MQYQTEQLENLTHSQQLLSELFIYIGQHHPEAYLSETPHNFFRLWAGQDPSAKIKVFTARKKTDNGERGELQGCVLAMLVANPLFIAKPFVLKFVEITHGDKAFEEYVRVVLESV